MTSIQNKVGDLAYIKYHINFVCIHLEHTSSWKATRLCVRGVSIMTLSLSRVNRTGPASISFDAAEPFLRLSLPPRLVFFEWCSVFRMQYRNVQSCYFTLFFSSFELDCPGYRLIIVLPTTEKKLFKENPDDELPSDFFLAFCFSFSFLLICESLSNLNFLESFSNSAYMRE